MKKYKLHIGVPTYGKPCIEFAMHSGWGMMYHIGRRHPEIEVTLHIDTRTYRQAARLGIVQEGLRNGADFIMMLDDDHTFTGEDFSKLWKAITEGSTHAVGDKEIHPNQIDLIGALYFTRGRPTCPCIFKNSSRGTVPIYYYPEKDALMPVDVIGFGMILIRAAAISDMMRESKQNPFDLSAGYGEDAAFCQTFRMMGKTVWCHLGVKIDHLDTVLERIGEAEYVRDLASVGERGESSNQGSAELYREERGPDHSPFGYGPKHPGCRPGWVPSSARVFRFEASDDGGQFEEGDEVAREGDSLCGDEGCHQG